MTERKPETPNPELLDEAPESEWAFLLRPEQPGKVFLAVDWAAAPDDLAIPGVPPLELIPREGFTCGGADPDCPIHGRGRRRFVMPAGPALEEGK